MVVVQAAMNSRKKIEMLWFEKQIHIFNISINHLLMHILPNVLM